MLYIHLKDYLMLVPILLYLIFSPLVTTIYRPLLFHPIRLPAEVKAPTLGNLSGEDIEILQPDGTKIHCWYYQVPKAKYTVLISHGNGSNLTRLLPLTEVLLDLGVSVFAYDYSGYGKSTGMPDLKNICENALSAYKYLINDKHLKPEQIILYGESLGGAVSANLACTNKVKALVIQSGFTSLHAIALEKFPILNIYPKWLFPKPSLDTVNTLSSLHIPVLIIHGINDPVVPYHHAEELFRAALEPKTLVTLSLSLHSNLFLMEPEKVTLALKTFIDKLK